MPLDLDELFEFAKREFALNRRHSDGTTEREHLASAERQTGRHLAALHHEPIAGDEANVWAWFNELSEARGSNGFGPQSLGYQDIHAWAVLTERSVRPSDVRAILALDRLWMADQTKVLDTARQAYNQVKTSLTENVRYDVRTLADAISTKSIS